jgi:RecA/RadA recombinase
MAKKKEGSKIDFKSMVAELQKIVPETDVASSSKFKIKNWVSLGNYHLNAQVYGSIFSGLPEGRMLLLAGDPGTGKTYLSLNACREAQRKFGSKIFWLDSEGAMDNMTMSRLGVDIENAVIIPVDSILKANQVILKLLDGLDGETPCEYMIVLDSLGNLTSDKETEDASTGTDKVDMTKQKKLKGMFRTILVKLANKGVPMIATTHTYSVIGSYVPKQEMSGGQGSKYGASISLMLSKTLMKKEDDVSVDGNSDDEIKKTGVVITCTQEKARYTKGGLPIKLQVSFTKGMNKFYGLQQYLDWENCGVAPGKLEEEIVEQEVNGKIKKVKTGNMVFVPDTSGSPRTWVIKSINTTIKNKDFWRYARDIFTKENLLYIDKVCQEKFTFEEYSDEQLDELEEMVDSMSPSVETSSYNDEDEDDNLE